MASLEWLWCYLPLSLSIFPPSLFLSNLDKWRWLHRRPTLGFIIKAKAQHHFFGTTENIALFAQRAVHPNILTRKSLPLLY